MSMFKSVRALARMLAALLCLYAASFAAFAQAPTARYADAEERLSSDTEVEAWYGGMRKLRHDFDQICGDTFCEGDYSNIYALRFRCSVESASGLLKRCVWVFAASNEEVDPVSGKIAVQPKVWRCAVPLAPKTPLSALLGVLAAEEPLYRPLPGTGKSIYDGLVDCL